VFACGQRDVEIAGPFLEEEISEPHEGFLELSVRRLDAQLNYSGGEIALGKQISAWLARGL
jgi:hypothetical protein